MTGQRVASKGGTMFSRPDGKHDRIVGQHGGYRQYTAAQRFAQDQDVGAYRFMITGQHSPGTAKPRLDLVGDEKDARRFAILPGSTEIAVVGDDHARFALDGLYEKSGYQRVLERPGQRAGIIERDNDEPGRIGSILPVGFGIGAKRDDGGRAAMEITGADDDLRLPVRDAFHLVGPSTAELDGRFHGFYTGIHGQYFVIAKIAGDVFRIAAKPVAVKGAGCQREAYRLLGQRRDDAGMAVSLVDRRIPAQEVEILSAVHVPYVNPGPPGKGDGKGMVIMRAISFFELQAM